MSTIIVLSSVTYAIKAQTLLSGDGIHSALTKQSDIKSISGCGYGLKLKSGDAAEAKRIISDAGIKILGITEVKQ